MKIKMYDNGELLREVEAQGRSVLIVVPGNEGLEPDTENMNYMRIDDQHVINQMEFKPYITKLISKYSSILSGINSRQFICVVDTIWEPTEKASKNSCWKIDIAKCNYWLRELTGADYMIKLRTHWTERWSEAQMAAAIMSQLLRVNVIDGSIMKYTEDMASRMIATFGDGYLEPHTSIPNIMTEEIKIKAFPQASGQITMDDYEGEPDEDEAEVNPEEGSEADE